MRKGSVAIVGCGWLGLPLAARLVAEGYTVHGSTTRPERLAAIEQVGAQAHLVRLPLAESLGSKAAAKTSPTYQSSLGKVSPLPERQLPDHPLWSCEQLVLTVPPGRQPDAERTYPAVILSAVLRYRRAQSAGRILFTSSTGVYEGATGRVDELTSISGDSPKVRKLALAESQIIAQSQRPHLILRLGGLYGGERHPGRYLAGRRDVPGGDAPINLVSRGRVVDEIVGFLDHPFWRQPIINLVETRHPAKSDFYRAYARRHGLDEPTFLSGGGDGKVVTSLYL